MGEALRGTIRTHVLYAAKTADRAAKPAPHAVPHLKGVAGPALAQAAAKSGVVPLNHDGIKVEIPVPGLAARALAHIDGRKTLQDIATAARTDWLAFAPIWAGVSKAMTDHGVMYYSRILKR